VRDGGLIPESTESRTDKHSSEKTVSIEGRRNMDRGISFSVKRYLLTPGLVKRAQEEGDFWLLDT